MPRYLLAIAVLIGLGFWMYSARQDRTEQELQQKVLEQRQQALTVSVKAMASQADASTGWAARLAGGDKVRQSPILSAELQEVWVPHRSILFVGLVEDIVKNEDGSFQVKIAYDSLGEYMFLGNSIRVNLRCPASVSTPLLTALKSHPRSMVTPDIAAIATIESIVSTSERDSNGQATLVLTGNGSCNNTLYLPESLQK